jgi:hypothetical protein
MSMVTRGLELVRIHGPSAPTVSHLPAGRKQPLRLETEGEIALPPDAGSQALHY